MSYAALDTRTPAGQRPGSLGYYTGSRLGAVGPVQVSYGPGGQFGVSVQSQATAQSIWDQIMNWAAASTIVPGAPNVLVVGVPVLLILFWRIGRR